VIIGFGASGAGAAVFWSLARGGFLSVLSACAKAAAVRREQPAMAVQNPKVSRTSVGFVFIGVSPVSLQDCIAGRRAFRASQKRVAETLLRPFTFRLLADIP
jgi:hypothetical protein